MDKKQMSEEEIKLHFITPAILNTWNKTQIRMNVYFTDGRVIVSGKTIKRGRRNFADYILEYKPNVPLAVVEAKDNNHEIGDGTQQALEYAEKLDLPFVFSSNGDGFVFHDRTTGKEIELSINKFPNPKDLWNKYKQYKGITEKIEDTITSDYFYEPGFKQPRYYQRIAINRTVEAIAKGQKRVLLVLATGTGKTYVAFQTIWRLKQAGLAKRVLYLADRNILIDQPKNNDLKPLSKVMTKISKRRADPAYEVYLSLYQAVSGQEDWKKIYKQFKPDFFDLIIVDECHRGSAKADSQWREILEYFKNSIQIGMTATPKETKDISNIDYFGKSIYTYSLKQGIEDGFLAPYKVIKIAINKDVQGYRPRKGELDKFGREIPDFIYTNKEFDKTLVIDERTKVVAKKITEFLKNTDRFSKTIVFCVDIDHAERMRRALVNENSDLVNENKKYVMRITGDNDIGKAQLDNFIDPASKYPVIVTTSKLMNTGVDAQTCKLIVLDSIIQSMTDFKQIIGRGTRIREDYKKYYFTIMDFRNATNLFADSKFDGEPIQIYTIKENQEVQEQETKEQVVEEGETILVSPNIEYSEEPEKIKKYYVNGVKIEVINEVVQYHDPSGKLITESLKDYTKNTLAKEFRSLNDFINKWTTMEKKQAIIEELETAGIIFDALSNEVGEEYDPFDLILHVAYGQKPLTRKERASKVQKDSYFNKYGEKARKVISELLDKYADEGIENLENPEVLKVEPLNKFGRPLEIMKLFGGKQQYLRALQEIKNRLYIH